LIKTEIIKLVKEKKPDLLVLLGPTASGKTKLSIDLALELNAEIISADSRMIYKEMNIGTAKPNIDERKKIPHHLIDIISPDEKFTASDFKKLTYQKIEEIKKQGKLPFLVGGTMLYIDSIVYNYNFGNTKPDPQIRLELEQKTTEELYKKLLEKDPEHAQKIEKNNRRHIIRPLEIIIQTGKKISKQKKKDKSLYNSLKIGLRVEKDKLHKRINSRVQEQIKTGLIEETKNLANKYNYSLPSMTGLGYKQIGFYLENKLKLEEATEILQRDTRRFAKRQITWWKRDKKIIWFDI